MNLDRGFLRRSDNKVIGVDSIEARLAGYRSGIFSSTSITAFWGFDAEGKLIEVWVWKVADSL